MKIKELRENHPRIYELAILRQKEAGNEANDELELSSSIMDGGFFWDVNGEANMWNDVCNMKFDLFYKKYPHTNDLPLINPEILEVKDPINKAWHEKFATHPIVPHAGEITPEMMKKFADKFAPIQEEIKTPEYYNNDNSVYRFCKDNNLNAYQFDLIKRISRCEKKGEFFSDLNKTKVLIDLYIKEQGHKFEGNK